MQTPETLVPRIGDVLVEQKLLTNEQLKNALLIQSQERAKGNSILIGQILVEHGYISQEVLSQTLLHQIILLHTALREANATLEQRVKDRTAELELAYARLSELATLKSNFLANISHELRTPLTHIKGYVTLLLENDIETFTPDQQYALMTINKASERLTRLIEDLILFSTADRNSLQINNDKFNIGTMIDSLTELQQSQAQAKNISLLYEHPDEQVIVNSDLQKVRWVINQLVDNAIKFTGQFGKVTIKITPLQNNTVRISVTDTGLGIPKERIEEMFEPFHQLDESTTRHHGGTGLGLSLARKILDALGSTIEVSSVLGQGSTFSFLLQQ
jgi:signal transduction histidine kinase